MVQVRLDHLRFSGDKHVVNVDQDVTHRDIGTINRLFLDTPKVWLPSAF